MMAATEQLAQSVGTAPACTALGIARASFYRSKHPQPVAGTHTTTPHSPRALLPAERQQVLATLNSERFADRAPAQVYAELLDENTYLCSIRTMYRLLDANQQVRERRDQLQHPTYHKPELLATAPNQVWSWDITKLLGPTKWSYFYLYVILDIFSRYVVGWLLARRESAELARRLIRETCQKHDIEPATAGRPCEQQDQLTIHSDRGPSMASQTVAQLLATLGVVKSHSRPHVSNDNPFSESQFKTMKYRPDFPDRFASFEHAHAFCGPFFDWYNNRHYHSGLGLLTPAIVHYGQSDQVLDRRRVALLTAYAAHPERFVHRPPEPLAPPLAVWINPPANNPPSPHPQEPTHAALH